MKYWDDCESITTIDGEVFNELGYTVRLIDGGLQISYVSEGMTVSYMGKQTEGDSFKLCSPTGTATMQFTDETCLEGVFEEGETSGEWKIVLLSKKEREKILCDAERMYPALMKLSEAFLNKETWNSEKESEFRTLLKSYFAVRCPDNGIRCQPSKCLMRGRKISWLEMANFLDLFEMLNNIEFEDSTEPIKFKIRKYGGDALDSHRAPGSFGTGKRNR